MAKLSSPPPASAASEDLEARLDAQIARIRSEIDKLREQKQQLSSNLLGSSRIQKHVAKRGTSRSDALQARLEQALEQQLQHTQHTIHRLAIGITSFPFTDPAPERRADPAMLGLRFDVPLPQFRNQYDALGDEKEATDQQQQYFVILRRLIHGGRTYFKVHTNTIPKHIDVETHAHHYLPLPDALADDGSPDPVVDGHDDSFQDDSGIDVTQDIATTISTTPDRDPPPARPMPVSGTSQNLHNFASAVHADLRAWHARSQSIAYLQHSLGLPSPRSPACVSEVTQLTRDARSLRIVFANATLVHLKISYEGYVLQAAAFGSRFKDNGEEDGEGEHAMSDLTSLDNEHDKISAYTSRRRNANHVRLFEVERVLMRKEDGTRVMIAGLLNRLRVLEERRLCS